MLSGRAGVPRPEHRTGGAAAGTARRRDRTRGERRLRALSPSSARFGSTGLGPTCSPSDFFGTAQERGSKVIESMVRDRVVRRLDEEEMDLMPPGYLPMWLAPKSETSTSQICPCSGSKTQGDCLLVPG